MGTYINIFSILWWYRKMKPIRFTLRYTIKRKDFYECQKLDGFKSRMYYTKIRKQLFINSVDKVDRLKNDLRFELFIDFEQVYERHTSLFL